MNTSIPSAAELQCELRRFETGQVRTLAERSGVPFTTLWKVRSGETKNPGVETVRQFRPHLLDMLREQATPETAAPGAEAA